MDKITTNIGKLKIFYHLACIGNWQHVLTEQMQLLSSYGFLNIHLSILGLNEDRAEAAIICYKCGVNVREISFSSELSNYERPALLAIEGYAKNFDGYILYLHSKGVSDPEDDTKAKWRKLMMSELVEKKEQCLSKLHKYDLIGVNWRDLPPVSHFCGNFWYASTAYLRKLPDFKLYYERPKFRIKDPKTDYRLGCEFWIGAVSEKPKVLSLAYSNVDFCDKSFWKGK